MDKKPLVGILCLALVAIFLWQIRGQDTVTGNGRRPNTLPINTAKEMSSNPDSQQPIIGAAITPINSPALRDLPPTDNDLHLDRELISRGNPLQNSGNSAQNNHDSTHISEPPDALRYPVAPQQNNVTLLQNFAGMDNINGYMPPDTVGEIGPHHYIQMVNKSIAVYSKSGQLLTGPNSLQQLWQGLGNCSQGGDPIVLYDSLADRWLLGQYANPRHICIAISHTGDPAGAYYLYNFDVGAFPDYAKFGVWPDGYYMSANEISYTATVFDRNQMLNGNAATFQKFDGYNNMLMPSDLDGANLPPANAPNAFYTFKDNGFHGGVDRLEIYALDVDWTTPANSTFTLISSIPVTPFIYTVCGFFNFDCIPQTGTSQRLDAISEWPMWRLQYRNFGSYETLVGNFTVDVGGDQAGIRWFELRKTGGNPWQLYQEGTHASGNSNYWLGSSAMDRAGNMALGYSVSSSAMFPAIRYATRLASDPLGTMPGENVLIDGTGAQLAINRWGDYSSLNVDPVDDCTFWYTNEYYSSSSPSAWQTRIGAFRIPTCGTHEIRLPIILGTHS